MTRKMAMGMLVLSTLGIAAVYGTAFLPGGIPGFALPLMVVSIATLFVAVMMLGAARGERLGPLVIPFVGVWLILVAGFLAALWLPADTFAAPHLFLGIPRRAAIVLYGIGLLPLIAMPIAYAMTFDAFTLRDEDLVALRARAQRILDEEQRSSGEAQRTPHGTHRA